MKVFFINVNNLNKTPLTWCCWKIYLNYNQMRAWKLDGSGKGLRFFENSKNIYFCFNFLNRPSSSLKQKILWQNTKILCKTCPQSILFWYTSNALTSMKHKSHISFQYTSQFMLAPASAFKPPLWRHGNKIFDSMKYESIPSVPF